MSLYCILFQLVLLEVTLDRKYLGPRSSCSPSLKPIKIPHYIYVKPSSTIISLRTFRPLCTPIYYLPYELFLSLSLIPRFRTYSTQCSFSTLSFLLHQHNTSRQRRRLTDKLHSDGLPSRAELNIGEDCTWRNIGW